jgi:hypothetical protein
MTDNPLLKFLEGIVKIASYTTFYPLIKRYLNDQAKGYAQQLVEVTETSKEVLKEPLVVEPTVTYASLVTELPVGEFFENRNSKKHVYIDVFSLGKDDVLEEVSHEIRDRIHKDNDMAVAEFFGIVGRILIKDPNLHYNIPTIEKLDKWRVESERKLENLEKAMRKYKEEIMRADKETFIRRTKEILGSSDRSRSSIKWLQKQSNETIDEIKGRLVDVDSAYDLEKSSLEFNLNHAKGYKAALVNRKSIENNPKGIYLLSEEEVRQRFF